MKMNDTKPTRGFRARYEYEINPELPADGKPEPFVFTHDYRWRRGWLFLKVIPESGSRWFGMFEEDGSALSGVYATPNEWIMCVIACGNGYWVPVNDPSACHAIKVWTSIRDVCVQQASQLMFFADDFSITAYGPDGQLWQTIQLSWDGISMIDSTPETLHLIAWDAPNEREMHLTVDVKTGTPSGLPEDMRVVEELNRSRLAMPTSPLQRLFRFFKRQQV